MLGWWGLLRTGRKWEPGGNRTAIPSTPAGQSSFPGLGRAVQIEIDHVWRHAQPVRIRVGVGVGTMLAPSQACDPPGEKAPHLQESREAKLSSRRVWALPAPRRGALGEALSLCVSLCYFFPSSVWFFFFPWSCFIGIPVIKTWCSLGALMWPAAAWAGPSLLLPPQGRGFGFWSRRNPRATCLAFPFFPSHPPPPSLKVVSRVQRTQAPCTPPQVVTPAACV